MITRRRILLLLAFGTPTVIFIGLLVFIWLAGPPRVDFEPEIEDRTPTVGWTGPTRPAADCPAFQGRGAELFDLSLLRDPSTLKVIEHGRKVTTSRNRRIALRRISFISYEFEGCELRPIRLQAAMAVPVGPENTRSRRLPGIVRLHGLLPHGEERDIVELAASLRAVVVAVIGPGFDGSDGYDSRPDHLFDVVNEPRRSWLWAQTVSLMRALTFLEARGEVDPSKLGSFGFSTGGLATLIVAGVDKRLQAAVVVSASAFLDLPARATPVPGWEVALLNAMTSSRTPDSPEWQAFLQILDPANFLSTVKSPVFLINGAQDQYFPIDATTKTFEALRAGSEAHRLFVIGGFDHGPIADRVMHRIRPAIMSNARYWFSHHLKVDTDDRDELRIPEIASVHAAECCKAGRCGECAEVQIILPSIASYEITEVELQVSTDSARSFFGYPAKGERRVFTVRVHDLDRAQLAKSVYFAEVVYRPLGHVRRLRLTSSPHIPSGFVPQIWPAAEISPP